MLVKKKNSEWFPSENKELKVGETQEISDPKQLIINGDVVGLGANGEELSAYELYGVIIKDEAKEFQEYLKLKKAESAEAALKAEKVSLETELTKEAPLTELKKVEELETATEVATGGEAKTATEAKKN
jgi:hypothetical protein